MYQYKAKITRIVDGDTVDCDRGKFGRILGKIINKDGQCANEMMCDIGHAMPYFGQSKEDIAAGHIKNRVKINKLIK